MACPIQKLIKKKSPVQAVSQPVHQHSSRPAQGASIGNKVCLSTHPAKKCFWIISYLIHDSLGIESLLVEITFNFLELLEHALELSDGQTDIGLCGQGLSLEVRSCVFSSGSIE